MILAVTGGRYEADGRTIVRLTRPQILSFRHWLKHLAGPLWEKEPHDGRGHRIRSGHAIGTDRHVEEICKRWGIEVNPYPVDQKLDGPWPAAGHRRNYRMLTAPTQADGLIAFPGNRGTAGCIETAEMLRIPVFMIDRKFTE